MLGGQSAVEYPQALLWQHGGIAGQWQFLWDMDSKVLEVVCNWENNRAAERKQRKSRLNDHLLCYHSPITRFSSHVAAAKIYFYKTKLDQSVSDPHKLCAMSSSLFNPPIPLKSAFLTATHFATFFQDIQSFNYSFSQTKPQLTFISLILHPQTHSAASHHLPRGSWRPPYIQQPHLMQTKPHTNYHHIDVHHIHLTGLMPFPPSTLWQQGFKTVHSYSL